MADGSTSTSTLVLITGASRGFGRSVALAFARRHAGTPNGEFGSRRLHVALVARSADGLAETAELLTKEGGGDGGRGEGEGDNSVKVSSHVADLSDLDRLDEALDGIFASVADAPEGAEYARAVLINNAGSLGPLGRCADPKGVGGDGGDASSLAELRSAIDFNVTSSIWVSSRFARRFSAETCRATVVNVSSLCALRPFPTMSAYCAGKAARDMFHSVLAKEEGAEEEEEGAEKPPSPAVVRALNYAPGPLDTDMTRRLAGCEELDGTLRTWYRESLEGGTLVDLDESARRLADLVARDEFESGGHVDYYDLDEERDGSAGGK